MLKGSLESIPKRVEHMVQDRLHERATAAETSVLQRLKRASYSAAKRACYSAANASVLQRSEASVLQRSECERATATERSVLQRTK